MGCVVWPNTGRYAGGFAVLTHGACGFQRIRLPPSPTTTRGAQAAGCARLVSVVSAISTSIARRSACDLPSCGSSLRRRRVSAVNRAARSSRTGQCDTRIDRAPANRNARGNPDRPSALGVPSPAAVLQADRITQSALSSSWDPSDAVNRKSSSAIDATGGVRARAGFASPEISQSQARGWQITQLWRCLGGPTLPRLRLPLLRL